MTGDESEPQRLAASAVQHMNTNTPLQVTLAISYVVLILLPCLVIGVLAWLPQSVVAGTFLAYAFALLPTFYVDHWLLGGIGFHSPAIFALLAVIVAGFLWPLAVLSAIPTVWGSTQWRRWIFGYVALSLGS